MENSHRNYMHLLLVVTKNKARAAVGHGKKSRGKLAASFGGIFNCIVTQCNNT